MTRALAQNLVAIGMADVIVRIFKVATDRCVYGSHYGCCQDQNIDIYAQVLTNLGVNICDGE